MNIYRFLLVLILPLFSGSVIYPIKCYNSETDSMIFSRQDTLNENQILYNGKIWRNLYYRVKEDQFLFSANFLPGSVTIGGKTFEPIEIKFDIYKDEIITPSHTGPLLQLNKEMVNSFSILYRNKNYQFAKIQEDTLKDYKGYFNILYKGKSVVFAKYKKEISILAVEGRYDIFYQTIKIYFMQDSIIHHIPRKSILLDLMGEEKMQVRSFIKKNRLIFSLKYPESIVPVVEFYDSLKQ